MQVSLPPHAGKATSLRGGYLRECVLSNYDYTKHLSPTYKAPTWPCRAFPAPSAKAPCWSAWATATRPIASNTDASGAAAAVCVPIRSCFSSTRPTSRRASPYLAATRINESFHGGAADTPDDATAVASNNLAIELHVPPAYKLNLPRFLRVVRLVPLQGASDSAGAKDADTGVYRQRLAEDLLNPARTVTAALRLEALGQQSVAALKTGLESTHPLVRFCAAESLAYLDCPAGGEELGAAVAKQPMLRAFALTALASLDESVSHTQLSDLLTTTADVDDEVR